jgi:hypothetical protein
MARDVREKLFEIDSKKIELGFLQQQFIVECKRFTAQNIEGIVRLAISSYPKKAISLGEKGLKPVKDQINALINNVSDMVEEHINTPRLWLHEQESLSSKDYLGNAYSTTGSQGPEMLETGLKKALSPAGEILISSGLDTDKNWEQTPDGMIYRHALSWTREMSKCIKHYSERFNELSKLVSEYESLSVQNAGNDALDLWDSI